MNVCVGVACFCSMLSECVSDSSCDVSSLLGVLVEGWSVCVVDARRIE